MIDLRLALPDPARGEPSSRRPARDTTRMYVRLAQQRADRGEPLDGRDAPAPAGDGVPGFLRRTLKRVWGGARRGRP